MAVFLEPTHRNPLLICCLVTDSWFYLPFIVLLAWKMHVFSWSLKSLSKALLWPHSPALMSSTFSIKSPEVPVRTPPRSVTGAFMGWGQGFTKVRLFILSAWPISGTQEWLLSDWVMHTDPDLIGNCPIKPRQLAHNKPFRNESV